MENIEKLNLKGNNTTAWKSYLYTLNVRSCYSSNVCDHPATHTHSHVEMLMHNVIESGRGTLEKFLYHEGGTSINVISVLINKRPHRAS